MPGFFTRETFIALRARREAYQIASDVLNPHLQIRSIACRNCGRPVPIKYADHHGRVECPDCNADTPIPPGLLKPEFAQLAPAGPVRPARPKKTRAEFIHWGAAILLGLNIGLLILAFVLALKL